MDPSLGTVSATEAVSLVSLGSGEPEFIDPDGASLGSQTRVFWSVVEA